jgi:tetratricopeptide (TPR) repeat protein
METSRLEKTLSRWAPPALVFFAALAAFAPCLGNDFVGWDDDLYLLKNTAFRGLGWEQLHWMFTTRRFGLYQPLTWLSFGLDYKLWGLEPWGYHLTNLLLHATAAVLFYFICLKLFEKAVPKAGGDALALGAGAAALAFAVHPLRVESVVWAVERKDVLSGALLLASVWAYLEERVALSCGLFALSLGAKASGVFLPAALLAFDVYPLRRPGRWREKTPFLAIAAGATAATMRAQSELAKLAPLPPINAASRVGQVFYGLAAFAMKTVWPASLSPYYPPRPWFGTWLPQTAVLAALGLAAAWAVWTQRRRYPEAAAAAIWTVLALGPVSGIVQQGVPHAFADRFTYLPSLGWCALFGGSFLPARGRSRGVLLAGTALLLAVWGALSWRQTMTWRDSLTLWSRAVQVEPSALAYDNLAVSQGAAGRADASVSSDRRALEIDSAYVKAYANYGLALKSTGRADAAEEAWRRGLSLAPESALLKPLLGELLCEKADSCRREGLALLRRSVEAGAAGKTRDDLAAALASLGDAPGARREYEAILAADGDDAIAHVNLGMLLDAAGERTKARNHYRKALRTWDQRAPAHADWGNSLLAEHRLDEAAFHYAEAIRIDPGLTPAQVNLGNVLARRGRYAEAAGRYRAALKKDPGSFEARANLSTVRRILGR